MTYPVSAFDWGWRQSAQDFFPTTEKPWVDLAAAQSELEEVTLDSDGPNPSALLKYIRGGGDVEEAYGYAEESLRDYEVCVAVIKAFTRRGAHDQAKQLLERLGNKVFEEDLGSSLRSCSRCWSLRPELVYPVMDLALADLKKGNLVATIKFLRQYALDDSYVEKLIEKWTEQWVLPQGELNFSINSLYVDDGSLDKKTRELVLLTIGQVLSREPIKV